MDLIPKALVIGGFVPPVPPGQEQLTAERVNRIWAEVAPAHGFTQLQMAPDHSAAQFLGATPDDGVSIQPPLIQVRSTIRTTASEAAADAQAIFRTVARLIGAAQIFNLGIRHVYQGRVPNNDGRGFVLHRVLSRTEEDLADLEAGAEGMWGGVKYLIPHAEGHYELKIEPFQADEMRSLFIDLDAQYQGPASVDSIANRADDAHQYLTGSVNRYLDRLAEPS
jgi:hypothetical protein